MKQGKFFLYFLFQMVLLGNVLFFSGPSLLANIPPQKSGQKTREDIRLLLLQELKKNLGKKEIRSLQHMALKYAGKSIPGLIEVMKSSKYSDRNRWVATFLVGRIMGKKAGPFLNRFIHHPNWVLRLASLKALLALRQSQYGANFAMALKDKSLIVRKQALENITKLSLTQYAPQVWAMLYDKRNYHVRKKGRKGANLIKEAIHSVGELRFKKAQEPLLSMIQKDKYKDIFQEIDTSLAKIMGKESPQGKISIKRHFWKRMALAAKTF